MLNLSNVYLDYETSDQPDKDLLCHCALQYTQTHTDTHKTQHDNNESTVHSHKHVNTKHICNNLICAEMYSFEIHLFCTASLDQPINSGDPVVHKLPCGLVEFINSLYADLRPSLREV